MFAGSITYTSPPLLIKTEKNQSNRYKIKNSTAQGISCTIASLMHLSHLITEMKKETQKWNWFLLFLWDSRQLFPIFRCVKNSETSNIKGKDNPSCILQVSVSLCCEWCVFHHNPKAMEITRAIYQPVYGAICLLSACLVTADIFLYFASQCPWVQSFQFCFD